MSVFDDGPLAPPDFPEADADGRPQMGTLSGGLLRDYWHPITMLYRDSIGRGYRRRVTASIVRYASVGIHYHTSVREEDDYIWNGRAWARPWGRMGPGWSEELDGDEPEGFHGRSFSAYPKKAAQAEAFVAAIFKKHFGDALYRLEWSVGKPQSTYGREGD